MNWNVWKRRYDELFSYAYQWSCNILSSNSSKVEEFVLILKPRMGVIEQANPEPLLSSYKSLWVEWHKWWRRIENQAYWSLVITHYALAVG
jgi:hypothetical protein